MDIQLFSKQNVGYNANVTAVYDVETVKTTENIHLNEYVAVI